MKTPSPVQRAMLRALQTRYGVIDGGGQFIRGRWVSAPHLLYTMRGTFTMATVKACMRAGWIERAAPGTAAMTITDAGRKALEEE